MNPATKKTPFFLAHNTMRARMRDDLYLMVSRRAANKITVGLKGGVDDVVFTGVRWVVHGEIMKPFKVKS